MRSALYEGTVRHRRFAPVRHEFRHRLAMAYVDLDEVRVGGELQRLLARRTSIVHFVRSDYLGDPEVPLEACVRDLVEERAGMRPEGPVRLLTQLRTAGWNFNPISLYYCFCRDGSRLEAVVFEVTNTPWAERAAYVVLPDADGRIAGARMSKELHVSPFLPMNLEYRMSCGAPDERCSVRFELWRDGERCFDADLSCRRAATLDRRGIRRMMTRHPLMPLVVSVEIYFEAIRLALRRAPLYRHPAPHAAAAGARYGTARKPPTTEKVA